MYVYQEYPKCLYRKDRVPVTVINREEEVLFAGDGYLTAEQFHGTPPAPVAEPVATPEPEVIAEPEKKKKKKDEFE